MTTKNNMKPVLLSTEQIVILREIQERERKSSPLGLAPSIHAIARELMNKALVLEAR